MSTSLYTYLHTHTCTHMEGIHGKLRKKTKSQYSSGPAWHHSHVSGLTCLYEQNDHRNVGIRLAL